jgi:catalase
MPNPDPIPYADDVEAVPSDEADDIRRTIEALKVVLQQCRERSGNLQRDVHVKSHGWAKGELRVLPNLQPGLAQGLFARECVFSAIIRFSNAAPQPQSDLMPDGRGMAIKLLNVAGERLLDDDIHGATQDFVMVNHPAFFAANVKDFLRVEQALAAPKDNKIAAATEAFTGGTWNPLHWRWREALNVVQTATQLPVHPASHIYFSMAPFRYGRFVAKYRARPAGELLGSVLDTATKLAKHADAMRLMLEETLRFQHLLFEFQVQLRTSAKTMPVEDATITWPESESPFRTIALLLIPRQEIGSNQQQEECDQLAFNVWHAIADHRPLGGINRLRREAYPISAAWRRGDANVVE